MIDITDLLEALMILCFGLSWPISIRKFLLLNAATGAMDWLFYLSWAFYFLNFTEITIDMLLYYRNVRLDRERDAIK